MAEDQIDAQTEGRSFGEVVERDDGVDEVENETLETTEDTVSNDTGDSEEQSTDDTGAEETETEEDQGEEEDQEIDPVTGTKLDKNPQSRVHQELANERKLRSQMQQVLASPELMKQFLKEQYNMDVTLGEAKKIAEDAQNGEGNTSPEIKEYKAEDFENLEDVASVVNEMQKGFIEKDKAKDAKIEELSQKVDQLLDGGRMQHIASNISQGVDNLRKAKELDPNSPEFVEGLEDQIVQQFEKLDLDPTTGRYRGNYSIEDVGSSIINAVRMGKKAGAQKTQTIVKNKTQGKVVTSPKVDDDGDTDNMDPGTSIAQGIARMMKNQ